ncbi:tetraacyldisaccharide 4'-kinase [Botrimarina sp.]|uniref:tetraacyldisaccharide 4'-kinase n=1 Tax=Botrimarina sp. TaxID=2795802 RepID=UPI0032ECDE4C
MRSSDFHDLVSGRRRGPAAAALRAGLAAAEGPYRLGVWWRNRRYDTRPELTHRVAAPVVSVGNLTLGGSGKTPMVKWVARTLRAGGVRVALASRGYGAEEQGPNDEALELEHALPDVPHVQNRDRVAAARLAIEELAAQAVVLDDGFQHRRLARDLDIVLLDATQPFGFGRLFPRGALREGVRSLRRAQVVCLTRSDLIDAAAREAIRRRAAEAAPAALWCESVVRPTALVSVADGAAPADHGDWGVEPLGALRGERVLAFCGIGAPHAFRETLRTLGAGVAGLIEFADHHRYTRDDVERITREAAACDAARVVCTTKDLVKIGVATLGGRPLSAVGIDLVLTEGKPQLKARLDEIVHRAKLVNPDAD